nr:Transducin (beta)-like 3 [Polyrhizophydium stewartii]
MSALDAQSAPADAAPAQAQLALKTSFKAVGTIESIFTGGKAALFPGGQKLITSYGDDVIVTDLSSSSTALRIKGETDEVTCFALKPDATHLVVAYKSLQLKVYDAETGALSKSFKAHEAPVLVMDFEPTSTLVATGSADATVKVWDVDRGYCTHNFKGHGGIVSAVKFHPDAERLMLVSGSDDCKIRLWNLRERSCIAVLTSHVSVIRGLDFSPDGRFLFSGARDKVINKWDVDELELVKTVPVFESVEALAVVEHEGASVLCSGGEKGILRMWDLESGELVAEQHKEENARHQISGMAWSPETSMVLAVTSDQNLLFYSADTLERSRQIAGYNEEVLDICFVDKDDRHLAVVTNTEQIRVYNVDTRDCEIIYGHSDTVLSIAASPDARLMVTGSKDHTAIVWLANPEAENAKDRFTQLASCIGHTEPVTAVALSRVPAGISTPAAAAAKAFVVTGSKDRTIKVWDVGKRDGQKLKARYAFVAHEKDIQCVAVAPNNKVFASGALDKTAKLWSAADGSLLGTFKGHKRGIWSVRFSPIDQVLATASTDKTIKLWSLRDFSCTFEGHLNTVLNVAFISAGMQLVSTGSDGLVKLWTIKDNECVATLDNHEDRIWGLAVDRSEKRVLSGSSDSTITIWEDVTAEEQEEQEREDAERILKEQDLSLYLARKDYRNAVMLALQLDQPFRILGILGEVRRTAADASSVTGSAQLDEFFAQMPAGDLEKLLLYIRDWNTHSKHAQTTQNLLYLILRSYTPETLTGLPQAKSIIESLLPYTERHFAHATELLKKSQVLEYTLQCMDNLIGVDTMQDAS